MVSDAQAAPISSRRSPRSAGRLVGGLTTSLVVHVAAVLFFGAFATLDWIGAKQPPAVEQDVDVVHVSSKEWDRNLAPAGSLPAPSVSPAAAHHKEAPVTALPQGQVVAVATGNDQKPEVAKYLAEHDNTVAKETRAREQTAFYGKAMPRQTTVHEADSKEQQKLKGNQGTGTDDAAKAEKTQIAEREIPKTLVQPKVATLERSEDGETRARGDSTITNGSSDHLQVKPGTLAAGEANSGSDGKAGVPDAPDNPHSAGVTGTAVGAAPNDFLQNVPIGDGTFLNTREYKYAAFFNRVKQRVGEQWRPNDEMRRKDLRGHAASRTRITVVDVTLDEEGRVSDVHVSQSCGVDFLDVEAVAAFQRAQPFPNPPTGLFDEDRRIRFRFGFHIDNDPGGSSPLLRGRHGHW